MGVAIYTVFDIETTGISAACMNEIIEFAGFKLDEHLEIVDEMHQYIKPYKPIPKQITELTGITNEMVANQPNRFEALPKIRNFIGDTICVAHNASFDFNFISTMCIQQNLPILSKYICTMKSYKKITGEKKGKLADACAKYNISLEHAHTAKDDARATVDLFRCLNDEYIASMDSNKWYSKSYIAKNLFINLMTSIVNKNPNKFVNNALEYQVNPTFRNMIECDVEHVYCLFEEKCDPVRAYQILRKNGDDIDFRFISYLFAIWLNEDRLPKFVYLEDPAITRQVKQMISYSSSFTDLINMHHDIYESDNINYSIYIYYYIKYRKCLNESDFADIFNDFFEQKISLMALFNKSNSDKLLTENPVKKAAVKAFVKYAKNNKNINENRCFIKKHLCSYQMLNRAVTQYDVRLNDGSMDGLKTEICVHLYYDNFFKVKVA